MKIINPKRNYESIEQKPHWYNYYAGYSHTFIKLIIESSELDENSIILDPWNGAGTTTLVSSELGYKSIGIDLNLVMKIIATAKQATQNYIQIAEEFISSLRLNKSNSKISEDALMHWFDPYSVSLLRRFELKILHNKKFNKSYEKVESLNISQCLLYTALFNIIREYLRPFIPSNPTWIEEVKY